MNKYIGKMFETKKCGTIKVIGYKDSRHIDVEFIDTGYETTVRLDKIKSGEIRDKLFRTICGVGFLGDGQHLTYKNGGDTPEYQCWVNMIKRCYDNNRSYKNKSYEDCTVSEEWHCFQDFAGWYKSNHPNDGSKYHLDKDSIIPGNRVYSPKTCVFLTPKQNSIISNVKNYKITLNGGEKKCVRNMAMWCANNGYCRSAMSAILHGKRSKHKDVIKVEEVK